MEIGEVLFLAGIKGYVRSRSLGESCGFANSPGRTAQAGKTDAGAASKETRLGSVDRLHDGERAAQDRGDRIHVNRRRTLLRPVRFVEDVAHDQGITLPKNINFP